MPKAACSVIALCAIGVLLSHGALASESDITSFNTLETASPATIEKVQLSDPNFKFDNVVIQRYGGLEQPTISFTVSNNSAVTIRKLYLTGVLKGRGRTVPLATQDFALFIPGGLQPGERKRFDLDATSYGDWSNVTKRELHNAAFTLTLKAVDDAKGDRIVKQ
jgi:hypothetical protein